MKSSGAVKSIALYEPRRRQQLGARHSPISAHVPLPCSVYPAVLRIITRNNLLFTSANCWYVAAVTAGQPGTTRSKLVLAWLLLWLTSALCTLAQQTSKCPENRAIPKCQTGACVVRRIAGLTNQAPQAVCNACLPGYAKVNRGQACGEWNLHSR